MFKIGTLVAVLFGCAVLGIVSWRTLEYSARIGNDATLLPCNSSPCQNGGTCVHNMVAVGEFVCTCASGWTGTVCADSTDECASSPCSNGATCTDGVDEFVCTCPAHFTGVQCESDIVDECLSSPCSNGGTCNNGVNSFDCDCAEGFEGVLCETDVDECASSPCSNGGTCTEDGPPGYVCACAAGYTGNLCFADECESSPCQNGGTCEAVDGGYFCHCAEGYHGDECAIADACLSNPCVYGDCERDETDYTCECYPSWDGVQCEGNVTCGVYENYPAVGTSRTTIIANSSLTSMFLYRGIPFPELGGVITQSMWDSYSGWNVIRNGTTSCNGTEETLDTSDIIVEIYSPGSGGSRRRSADGEPDVFIELPEIARRAIDAGDLVSVEFTTKEQYASGTPGSCDTYKFGHAYEHISGTNSQTQRTLTYKGRSFVCVAIHIGDSGNVTKYEGSSSPSLLTPGKTAYVSFTLTDSQSTSEEAVPPYVTVETVTRGNEGGDGYNVDYDEVVTVALQLDMPVAGDSDTYEKYKTMVFAFTGTPDLEGTSGTSLGYPRHESTIAISGTAVTEWSGVGGGVYSLADISDTEVGNPGSCVADVSSGLATCTVTFEIRMPSNCDFGTQQGARCKLSFELQTFGFANYLDGSVTPGDERTYVFYLFAGEAGSAVVTTAEITHTPYFSAFSTPPTSFTSDDESGDYYTKGISATITDEDGDTAAFELRVSAAVYGSIADRTAGTNEACDADAATEPLIMACMGSSIGTLSITDFSENASPYYIADADWANSGNAITLNFAVKPSAYTGSDNVAQPIYVRLTLTDDTGLTSTQDFSSSIVYNQVTVDYLSTETSAFSNPAPEYIYPAGTSILSTQIKYSNGTDDFGWDNVEHDYLTSVTCALNDTSVWSVASPADADNAFDAYDAEGSWTGCLLTREVTGVRGSTSPTCTAGDEVAVTTTITYTADFLPQVSMESPIEPHASLSTFTCTDPGAIRVKHSTTEYAVKKTGSWLHMIVPALDDGTADTTEDNLGANGDFDFGMYQKAAASTFCTSLLDQDGAAAGFVLPDCATFSGEITPSDLLFEGNTDGTTTYPFGFQYYDGGLAGVDAYKYLMCDSAGSDKLLKWIGSGTFDTSPETVVTALAAFLVCVKAV